VPEPGEVNEIHVLSARDLVHPETYSAEPYPGMEGPAETLPYFRVDGVVVWGMTGYLLGRFLELAADWGTPDDQPLEHPGATHPSE